jgi:hypothetical protein
MISVIKNIAMTGISPGNLPKPDANSAQIQTGLEIVFGLVGALALVMITISGLRYITSAGDPQQAAKAKNGIVYSLVGIAIAVTAEGIIAFAIKMVGN